MRIMTNFHGLRLALAATCFCGLQLAAPAFALTAPAQGETGTGTPPSSATQTFEGAQSPATGSSQAPLAPGAPTAPTAGEPTAAATDTIQADIIRDMSTLPEPVRKMRQALIEAAASGDIERLKPLTNPGPNQTQVMDYQGDDPVGALKNFSGDPDGQEILAIVMDLLSASAVRLEAGQPEEVYVWPYFAGKSISALTPPERVDLLRIVTAGDLIGMEENDAYNFYRIGLSPDGQWKFFTGGD
jgi:hypothetical protein